MTLAKCIHFVHVAPLAVRIHATVCTCCIVHELSLSTYGANSSCHSDGFHNEMQKEDGAVWELQHRRFGAGPWSKSDLLTDPVYKVTGLQPGTQYQMKARGGYIAEGEAGDFVEWFQFSVEGKMRTNPSKDGSVAATAAAPDAKPASEPTAGASNNNEFGEYLTPAQLKRRRKKAEADAKKCVPCVQSLLLCQQSN